MNDHKPPPPGNASPQLMWTFLHYRRQPARMVISVKIWKYIGRINRLRKFASDRFMLSFFLRNPSSVSHTLVPNLCGLESILKTSKRGNNLFKTVCKLVVKAFKWLMLSYWRVFIYITLKVRLVKRNVSLPIIISKWMWKICKFSSA